MTSSFAIIPISLVIWNMVDALNIGTVCWGYCVAFVTISRFMPSIHDLSG